MKGGSIGRTYTLMCFDIGGSTIKPAVATSPGQLKVLPTLKTPLHDYDAFIDIIASCVGDAQGISISITGVIDPETGILKCANIACADRKPLAADLKTASGLPVHISNDADCFTLAEATLGAGCGHRTVFGIILGSGVGGALVIDGRIVRGSGGFVGEWGHGSILAPKISNPARDIPHFKCGCGQNGCVNTVGGARGIEALHHFLSSETRTSREIMAAWRARDAAAENTLAAYIELVCPPLAFAINITGADIVPVGGGLSDVPELITLLDQNVREKLLRKTTKSILVKAHNSLEPGLVGAAIVGFQELKNG